MSIADDTIAEQVAQMHQRSAGRLPASAAAAFAADQARLGAAGVPGDVAVAGAVMPSTPLIDADGGAATLTEIAAGRPTVVVFYRGTWCPYCNLALRTYQAQLVPELDSRGVVMVAVSPQRPDGSMTMQQHNELTFAVLSDPGNQLASGLGILSRSSDEALDAQRALGLDVRDVNADGEVGIPMPTVVVVDGAGIIRWIDVRPNYSERTEPVDVLRAVDALSR